MILYPTIPLAQICSDVYEYATTEAATDVGEGF